MKFFLFQFFFHRLLDLFHDVVDYVVVVLVVVVYDVLMFDDEIDYNYYNYNTIHHDHNIDFDHNNNNNLDHNNSRKNFDDQFYFDVL